MEFIISQYQIFHFYGISVIIYSALYNLCLNKQIDILFLAYAER